MAAAVRDCLFCSRSASVKLSIYKCIIQRENFSHYWFFTFLTVSQFQKSKLVWDRCWNKIGLSVSDNLSAISSAYLLHSSMHWARLFCLPTEIILSAIATVYHIPSPGVCAVTATANLILAICMTFGTLQIQDQSCKHVLRSHWTGPNQTTDLRNWGVLQIQDRSPQLRPVASKCVCDWLHDAVFIVATGLRFATRPLSHFRINIIWH